LDGVMVEVSRHWVDLCSRRKPGRSVVLDSPLKEKVGGMRIGTTRNPGLCSLPNQKRRNCAENWPVPFTHIAPRYLGFSAGRLALYALQSAKQFRSFRPALSPLSAYPLCRML